MTTSNMSFEIPIHEFEQDEKEDQLFDLFPLLPKKEKSTTSPHRHDYYELFLFRNGGGSHIIDFKEIDIEANSVHIVAPGQVHHLKRSDDSVGYAIMFLESFLRNSQENRHFISKFAYMEVEHYRPTFSFSHVEFNDIIGLIELMLKGQKRKEVLNLEIIRHYINVILLNCRQKACFQKDTGILPNHQLYAAYRKNVDAHFKTHKKVMEYVSLLNTNERLLNQVCRKNAGKTPSNILFDRIIMEAKRLIANTELSLKEICYELNYEDQAHFSKFFKSRCGHTPSKFRELYK